MKININILVLFLVTVSIFSQTFELEIVNNTDGVLEEVSIAPPGADFEYNYLEMDLGPGASTSVIYESDNSGNCTFDVLAYSPDGTSYLKVDLDLCYDQKIFISEADIEGAESDGSSSSASAGGVTGKLTANKWKMMFNGEEYGSLLCKADGSAVKTGSGDTMRTEGTWSYDESSKKFTMNFPSEGGPVTGDLKDLGGSFKLSVYDGAIIWKLEKM